MAGRGRLDPAPTPHRLADALPAVLRDAPPGEPAFLDRFCGGLDGVFAPIFTTLDALEAYVDPRLTPSDFLPWMRGWVGLAAEVGLSERSSRTFVREAAELYRWQGTARGHVMTPGPRPR